MQNSAPALTLINGDSARGAAIMIRPAASAAIRVSRGLYNRPASKFADLDPFDPYDFLRTTGVGRSIRKHGQGETIFLQGNPACAVFYVQKGKVQLTVVSEHGKEGVISVLQAGEFFGEGCLAGQSLHLATATAATEAVIVEIEKGTMVRMLRDEPAYSQIFMAHLLARNTQIEADLADHLFNSSEKRLARILLMMTNIGRSGQSESVSKVSQEVLAARVGTTRSRINFFMNKFRKLGFIEYDAGTMKIYASLMDVVVA